jgi:hypothetical protein
MPLTLLALDTTGIQDYIFGTNRLAEQIGASELVARATGEWAFRFLPRPNNSRAAGGGPPDLDPNLRIEDGALAAEVLYAGGGNLVALFREPAAARAYLGQLSRRVICEASGLHLVAATRSFAWEGEALAVAVGSLLATLAERKRASPASYPLLGLGVSAACQSTGLPAVGVFAPGGADSGDSPRLASAETLAKLAPPVREAAQERLRAALALGDEWVVPQRTDELGRTEGTESHVAVIHADGNGMGRRLRAIAARYPSPAANRRYIEAVRAFSNALTSAARDAQRDVVQRLISWLRARPSGDPFARAALAVPGQPGRARLPLRPLIFGGDDLTLLADARLGLALAVEYLRRFEALGKNLPEGAATAAAGIAFVRTHYPLARAYQLAGELTKSAKRFRRDLQDQGRASDVSTLDWHVALGGLAGDLKEIRRREYQAPDGWLTARPVTLTRLPFGSTASSWPTVEAGIRAFQGPAWAERRNKVKGLRDALRAGPIAVERFRLRFTADDPLPEVVPGAPNASRTGWDGKTCVYFDAIEAVDWYTELVSSGGWNDAAGR